MSAGIRKTSYRVKARIRVYTLKHKNELIESRGNKCDVCRKRGWGRNHKWGTNLQIHHKKYTRNFKDWLLLCKDCHRIIHNKKIMQNLYYVMIVWMHKKYFKYADDLHDWDFVDFREFFTKNPLKTPHFGGKPIPRNPKKPLYTLFNNY